MSAAAKSIAAIILAALAAVSSADAQIRPRHAAASLSERKSVCPPEQRV
jgi:hypothetical protein